MDFPLEVITSHASDETLSFPASDPPSAAPTASCEPLPDSICYSVHDVVSSHSNSRPTLSERRSSRNVADQEPEDATTAEEGLSTVEPSNLPPADRGTQAWMYLLGAFIVEMLVWGACYVSLGRPVSPC